MRNFDVEWTQTAIRDLENIIEYIAADNVSAADEIFKQIKSKCGALTHFPLRGRVVPGLRVFGIHVYHELIIMPWRIIYKASRSKVYVLAVIDSRRNMEDILLERFL